MYNKTNYITSWQLIHELKFFVSGKFSRGFPGVKVRGIKVYIQ